jgi:hypothetical protein
LEAAEMDDATHVHPHRHRSPIELEPVTADTFVADLTQPSREVAALLASAAASPRRRIYD